MAEREPSVKERKLEADLVKARADKETKAAAVETAKAKIRGLVAALTAERAKRS